jgi:hypothetical protein
MRPTSEPACSNGQPSFNGRDKVGACDLFSKSLISDVRGQGEGNYETRCAIISKALDDPKRSFHYDLKIKEIIVAEIAAACNCDGVVPGASSPVGATGAAQAGAAASCASAGWFAATANVPDARPQTIALITPRMPALCQQLYLFEYIELPAATTTHQGLFEVRHSDSPSGASSTSAARDAGGSLAAFLCTRKAAGCTQLRYLIT